MSRQALTKQWQSSQVAVLLIALLTIPSAAYSHGGGGGGGHGGGGHSGGQSHSSSSHDANNHANQMNPNNDAYWQSRGYSERPDDWEEISTSSYDDNHANQLNPNNQAYWQSRGIQTDGTDLPTGQMSRSNIGTSQPTQFSEPPENSFIAAWHSPWTKITIGVLVIFSIFKRKTIVKHCPVCKTKNRIKPHNQDLTPICAHCKSAL